MSAPQEQTGGASLQRSIGLAGAVALTVGAVIGAGIYALVAPIAAQAGAALWLAFAIALVISLIGILPLIQLAGALPRAGAGYLFASRLLTPCAGFMASYWILLGGAASTALVALVLGDSIAPYLPPLASPRVVAVGLLVLFCGIYQFGLRLAMSLQGIMAAQLVAALLLYAVAGGLTCGVQFGIAPPQGIPAFLMATLLCYSTCMGFQVIAEMGEEIKHARRNIPLALLIAGAVVATIYISVGSVFIATIPYDPRVYAGLQAPLNVSASRFLSPACVRFVELGAITAGLTSLNAAAIALPREWFAQARDGMAPSFLAHISPRTHTPQHAVTAYFILVMVLLGMGFDHEFYGCGAGIGILAMSSVLSVAALRLPARFPELYRSAYITFPKWLLYICAAFTVAFSIGFAVLLLAQRPGVLVLYAVWSVPVAIYYKARTRRFTVEDWRRVAAVSLPDENET